MIGPKHDNGVVAIARGVERIKQKPNALVSEIDARQVRLNALPPGQFIFDDLLDDGGWAMKSRSKVLQIIQLDSGQRDLIQREFVIVFAWRMQRHMWAIETTGEEERFVVLPFEPLGRPLGHFPIGHVRLANVQR